MTANNEFRGNVGQVANGDASSVTSNGNVVTLNFVGKEEIKEVEKVTDLQRKRIYDRVRKLMKLTGRARLDIYGDLLSEFGVKKLEMLPASKYKEACAFLDNEITLLSKKSAPVASKPEEEINKPDTDSARAPVKPEASIPAVIPLPKAAPQACKQCEHAQNGLNKAKTINRVLAALLMISVSGLAWALLAVHPTPEAKALQNSTPVCEHSGDRFSIGGKVKNPDNTLMQCVQSDGAVVWQTIEQPKKIFAKPQAKRQQQSDSE